MPFASSRMLGIFRSWSAKNSGLRHTACACADQLLMQVKASDIDNFLTYRSLRSSALGDTGRCTISDALNVRLVGNQTLQGGSDRHENRTNNESHAISLMGDDPECHTSTLKAASGRSPTNTFQGFRALYWHCGAFVSPCFTVVG